MFVITAMIHAVNLSLITKNVVAILFVIAVISL